MIKKISIIVTNIEKSFLIISLVIMGIIMSLEVFFRLFLGGLTWSEELAKYLFVWLVFIGLAYAINNDIHIRLDILILKLPEKVQKIFRVGCDVLEIIFLSILIYPSIEYYISQCTQKTATLGVSMGIVAIVMPISFVLCIFNLVLDIIIQVKGDMQG